MIRVDAYGDGKIEALPESETLDLLALLLAAAGCAPRRGPGGSIFVSTPGGHDVSIVAEPGP